MKSWTEQQQLGNPGEASLQLVKATSDNFGRLFRNSCGLICQADIRQQLQRLVPLGGRQAELACDLNVSEVVD